MAKRNFHNTNWTPTATADGTPLTSATYMALQGGTSTQLIDILEVMINGLAGSSAPTLMQLARDSTVSNSATALSAPAGDGPMHPSTAALAAPPVSYTAAGTGPSRSSATSQGRLELGLNAFGGIVRWNAAPTQQMSILGNTASLGEVSLSAYTGGTVGAISAHMLYEPY